MASKCRLISRAAAERLASQVERRSPSAQEKFSKFKDLLAGGSKPALGVFNNDAPRVGFRVFEHDLLSAGVRLLSGVNPLVDSIFVHLARTKLENIAVVSLKRFHELPANRVSSFTLKIPSSWTRFEITLERSPLKENGKVDLKITVENLTLEEQSVFVSFRNLFKKSNDTTKRFLVPSRKQLILMFSDVPFGLLEHSQIEFRRATNELQE